MLFDLSLGKLRELHQWSERLKLVKVDLKSHTGCHVNKMADQLADKGCASDEELVSSGQQKYGFLRLLRVRASIENLINDENAGHWLPRDGMPNKLLLKSICSQPLQHHLCSLGVTASRHECCMERP